MTPAEGVRARLVGRRRIPDSERLLIGDQAIADRHFPSRRWVQIAIWGSTVDRCSFDNQSVESVQIGGGSGRTLMRSCSFNGARWKSTTLGDARFERCSFRNIQAGPWLARRVDMVDCVFSGRLTDLVFWARDPSGLKSNEFKGNDFTECDLVGPAFRGGVDLLAQGLPVAPHYVFLPDAAESIARAHPAIASWTDLASRERAMKALGTMRSDVATGQRSLFLDKRIRRAWPERLQEAFYGLLTNG
jgi:hypothetical protein